MSEEDFSKLNLEAKWKHLADLMDYIQRMDATYEGNKEMFSLRRRFNPHHPAQDVEYETKLHKEKQRNLRIDQYQRWAHAKALYAEHRDELANTLSNEKFIECKNIMERIFTMEVDDALREIIK